MFLKIFVLRTSVSYHRTNQVNVNLCYYVFQKSWKRKTVVSIKANCIIDKENRKHAENECALSSNALRSYFLHSKEKTYSVYLGLTFKVSHHSPQDKQHFAFGLKILAQRHLCQWAVEKDISEWPICLCLKRTNKMKEKYIWIQNRFYDSENAFFGKEIARVGLAVEKI